MKSISIKVDLQNVSCVSNPGNPDSPYTWHLFIPILPAFSVEYFSMQIGPLSYTSVNDSQTNYVNNSELVIPAEYDLKAPFGDPDLKSLVVVLHYHGIRDYSSLFPWISDSDLRNRLGSFYEEAEKNFEQGSWLSFALMCGAVFEGMLYAKLGMPRNNTLSVMTTTAYNNQLLTQNQKATIDNVRQARNLIHSNNFQNPYITRTEVMDMRTILDQLIKEFSV